MKNDSSGRFLPQDARAMISWSWQEIEPYYQELANRQLTSANLANFMSDWTYLHERMEEVYARLNVNKDLNTADKDAEAHYLRFLDEIFPKMQEAEQRLKRKLIDSGLRPSNFDLPLRRMQTEVAIYRNENLPLFVEQHKLGTEYNKIVSSQTVFWEGKEVTITQLKTVYQEIDRKKREEAWRLAMERQLADRPAINELWKKFLSLRLRIAQNAGFSDYRAYRWQDLLRFDYTPENCRQFHKAIEEVVVPVAVRIYERRRRYLGVERLSPWDLDVDPLGRPALKPFTDVSELKSKVRRILSRISPQLGAYFQIMIDENLLDLDNRKNKAPGGYCTSFDAIKRPFIFMNAVGLHGDVMTLFHESGHACHYFEASSLPYHQQRQVGLEFAEVASMGMELLTLPYLSKEEGGFYDEEESARAKEKHLEDIILFWPYMAVVDAFQHWVYENPALASNPDNCDQKWQELWKRFMPGVDWEGLEDALVSGWQRKLHIHLEPFYYIEYGLAQLGACYVWANAQQNQTEAVANYRRALALGGTRSLPELYKTAGALFAFDAGTLKRVVNLIEEKLSLTER